jgi:hypothetical protein
MKHASVDAQQFREHEQPVRDRYRLYPDTGFVDCGQAAWTD